MSFPLSLPADCQKRSSEMDQPAEPCSWMRGRQVGCKGAEKWPAAELYIHLWVTARRKGAEKWLGAELHIQCTPMGDRPDAKEQRSGWEPSYMYTCGRQAGHKEQSSGREPSYTHAN